MFRRRPAAPLAPRRPEPDRQCAALAATTGERCERYAGPDGLCSTHRETQGADAVTAAVSAVTMDGATWQTWRFGSTAWQREAWRLYDICGQLRFVANWVGNSASRCRLYVADVDESGEPGSETEDADVAALAAGPLGSGPAKDEALRLLGVNLFVAGEAYVVAEADGDDGDDRWFVAAGQQINRSGTDIRIRRSLLQGGGDMLFRPDMDLLLRVWTPHPADTDQADSPTRSAIPDLREIEALRKREFAELDSRLAGAGLLLIPDGIDFPRGDSDPAGPSGLAAVLMRAMATSLRDRASAEALVPIIAKAPPDAIDKIKHLTFWSDLSDQILPLREAAIKSLAQSLDVPAEILLGMTESNHWCATDKTEILTPAGWRHHTDLHPGDLVRTLDHTTGQETWQPATAVNRWHVLEEEMLSIEGPGHSSLTTLAHRWPIVDDDGQRTFVTSAELSVGHVLPGPDGPVPVADCALTRRTYTGTIWCPTTPNGTWLARHEGTVFYTGNSAWLVSEDAVSTQIVPLLSRIADALTTGYLHRAVEQLGKDPDRYAYAFDVAPLTSRPNRAADALNYHSAGLLSDAAAVEAGAFRLDQMPDDEERLRRIVERAVSGAPSLLADPMLQELLGLKVSAQPPPPPPPAELPPGGGGGGGPGEVEQDRDIPDRVPQTEEQTAALIAVAGLATLRALALAGGRLVPHRQRDRWPNTPRHQLHARHGPISRADADQALRGAWDEVALVAGDLNVDPAALADLLHGFAAELLTRGMAYDPALLRDLVAAAVRSRRLTAPAGVAA